VVGLSSPPAIVGFLDQGYCYISVAIQIPQGAGLTLVLLAEE
jgi:hypothetical protein